MTTLSDYREYARQEVENFALKNGANRYLLVDAVKDLKVETVLDVGCGAGQELLPFLEKTEAFCVGVDTAEELGAVVPNVFQQTEAKNRVAFLRSFGENLPFADASFDVALCRVALPCRIIEA